jgi:AraC-like DNA-binding protein
MDPFLDLIQLLRPRATLWRRIEADGRWGVSFPKLDDLLFCSVVRGECLIVRPLLEPVRLTPGDFVLIRTSSPFRFTSDLKVRPVDSQKAFADVESGTLKLGEGSGRPVELHGGRFVFDTANENLLTGLLPPLIHIAGDAGSAERIQGLLKMNASEAAASRPGGDFVIARLMELLLVEILRDQSRGTDSGRTGMLAGLADPVTAVALRAMHKDIARSWTIAELARLAGVSRSKLAARFQELLGVGPIGYLLDWRMAVAKDELRKGALSLSEIAFLIGFQSVSAFSTAFSRVMGCPPKRYAISLGARASRGTSSF